MNKRRDKHKRVKQKFERGDLVRTAGLLEMLIKVILIFDLVTSKQSKNSLMIKLFPTDFMVSLRLVMEILQEKS